MTIKVYAVEKSEFFEFGSHKKYGYHLSDAVFEKAVKLSELRELLDRQLKEITRERSEMVREIKECDDCERAREADYGNLCSWHTAEEAETLKLTQFIEGLLAELSDSRQDNARRISLDGGKLERPACPKNKR